ncbi:MAG: hypothetical protein ACT4QC_12325 [Planctomycetaceae bacterium]
MAVSRAREVHLMATVGSFSVTLRAGAMIRRLAVAVPLSLLMAGCGNSGAGNYEQVMNSEEQFVASLKAAGGHAEKKLFPMPFMEGAEQDAWFLDLQNAQISDELIRLICELPTKSVTGYVAEMNFRKSGLTDAQLLKLDASQIGRIVKNLDLSETEVSDASVGQLKTFYCLEALNLKGTRATADGVKRLKANQQTNADVPPRYRKGPKVEM